MKYKSYLFYLIVNIFLLSCAQKENDAKKIKKISFIPGEISEWYLENEMESFYFVPLASNNEFLIQNISKLYITDNEIIVIDNFLGSIFIFDRQGNARYKISAKGKGPGEYSRMDDALFIENRKQFEVLDWGSKRILFYSFSGDFLYDKKINNSKLSGFRFFKNNGTYIFDRGQFNFDGMRISIYDDERINYIASFLPIPKQILNLGYHYNHTFETYRDSLYFVPMMDDKIYSISLDSVLPAYIIDYPGKKNIDYHGSEIFTNIGSYNLYMANNEHIYSLSNLFINDHYIYFTYNYKNITGLLKLFYSKETGKIKQFRELRSFINPKLRILSQVEAKDGDYFVMGIHQTLNKFLPDSISRNLNEQSNPVLIFFKIKDF